MGLASRGAGAAAALALVGTTVALTVDPPADRAVDGAVRVSTTALHPTTTPVSTAVPAAPKAAAPAKGRTRTPASKPMKNRVTEPVEKTAAKKRTTRGTPTRLPAWEKDVLTRVQKARAAERIRPMRGNVCLKGVAVAMAQRVATTPKRSATADWTPADTTRLLRCTSPRNKIHADAAWESNSRTPALWVSKNYTAVPEHVHGRWREVGVGAYKDRNGRAHVVVVQMFVTKR